MASAAAAAEPEVLLDETKTLDELLGREGELESEEQ